MCRYYEKFRSTPNSQTMQDVLTTLEAKATFEGSKHAIFLRVAHSDGKIYVDLGTPDWDVIEISEHGWTVS